MGEVVKPAIPNILRESAIYVAICICILQSLYITFQNVYDRGFTAAIGMPPPAPEVCQTQVDNEKCGRPDLFAFQIVSGIVFWICGGIGLYSWFWTVPHGTPESRLYGYDRLAKTITILNFSYQLWDFTVSLGIPEHRTAIMMTHHVVAAILCSTALYNHMVGYYAIFFLGLSEVSSIFLVTLDFSNYFVPLPGTWFQFYVGSVAGPCFAVTFLLFRVVMWWDVSRKLFGDVKNVNKDLRPGRTWILYVWLFFNLPMGTLQLYWLTIILGEAQKVVFGE